MVLLRGASAAPITWRCRVPAAGRRASSRSSSSSRCWSGLPLLVAAMPSHGAATVRGVLPRRLAGVRRRPRRAAAAAGRGGAARLGDERCVPRRLRRRAGGARAAVHLRRLSRRGDGAGAERLGWRRDLCLVAIFLPSFLLVIGRAAVLGRAAAAAAGAVGAARRQRRGGRPAAGGALQSGLDQRISARPTSPSASPPSCCCSCGQAPPWLVVVFCALGGAATAAFPFGQ